MGNSKFYIGDLIADNLKLGDNDITVYLGDMLLYPLIKPQVVATFNVTDTRNPTQIASAITNISKISIDDNVQKSVTTGYTFSTAGEHIVKYEFINKTNIDVNTFRDCISLISCTIDSCVTSIGDNAFRSCIGLTSCTIGSCVTSIGYSTFYQCSGLTSIVIPNSVTSIGASAFRDCHSLTSCTIGSGVTSIGNSAFQGCSGITSIVIPNSVTSIGDYTLYQCSGLTSCTIGSCVTSIGAAAFGGCIGLTNIISNSVTAPTILYSTFRNVGTNGTLYVPIGSGGYDTWMQNANYYLGLYDWTKVEQ